MVDDHKTSRAVVEHLVSARPPSASATFRARSGTATRSAAAKVSRPGSRPPDSILDEAYLLAGRLHDPFGGARRRASSSPAQSARRRSMPSSDSMAISFMKTVMEGGVRVPEDLSVVGFDGIEFAEFVTPTLTTIQQPRHEIGRTGRAQPRSRRSRMARGRIASSSMRRSSSATAPRRPGARSRCCGR